LVGQLSFDPEAFARLKPTDQSEQLRRAVGLDTTKADQQIAALYATRRDANRDAKQAQAALDALPRPVALELMPEKSVADLTSEGERLKAEGDAIDQQKLALNSAELALDSAKGDVADLEEQLAKARERLTKREKEFADISEKWTADKCEERRASITNRLNELRNEYRTIDATNREARAHNASVETFTKAKAKAEELAQAAKDIDARHAAAVEAKEQLIKAARFPIEGLSITDAGVVLNGIPFADLNTAERIKVSTLIAMAANPKLRVIFVREGALINRANLKIITDLANERGYQVWIEKFQEEAGSEGIHIVDGGVALIDGKPVEAPVPAPSAPLTPGWTPSCNDPDNVGLAPAAEPAKAAAKRDPFADL
jgi:hypothetical protein